MTKRFGLLAFLALLAIGAAQQFTITRYPVAEDGVVCYGDPEPFDCVFIPVILTPTGLPPRTTATPTVSATPTSTATQTHTPTVQPPPKTPTPTVTALPPLLTNGNFEQPWQTGWTRFDLWPDRPTFNDERGDSLTRIDGSQSLRIWNNFRCILSGVYQTVSVQRFATVEFSTWGRVWASEGVFPNGHDQNVFDGIAVGVDPSGGINPTSSGIVWAENFSVDNGARVTVRTVALSSRITLFIRGRVGVRDPNGTSCEWPHTHMQAYVDGAGLVVAQP